MCVRVLVCALDVLFVCLFLLVSSFVCLFVYCFVGWMVVFVIVCLLM